MCLEVSTIQAKVTLILGSLRRVQTERTDYTELRNCEQIQLTSVLAWQELPMMSKSRAYFNPCEYFGLVYLCGYRSDEVEVFDPQSSSFRASIGDVGDRAPSLLFVEGGELVILSVEWVSRWRNDMVKLEKTRHSSCVVDSDMAPVVDSANGVVYVACNGVCVAITIDGSSRTVIA